MSSANASSFHVYFCLSKVVAQANAFTYIVHHIFIISICYLLDLLEYLAFDVTPNNPIFFFFLK